MCGMEEDPTTGTNGGALASHDVPVRKVCRANAKAAQDDLQTTVPVARRLPQNNGRSQLTQFIAVLAGEDRFVVGMEVTKEPLDF